MKFGECVNLAAEGALDGWKDSVRGRLALVIVLDQFPRNIYRQSPKAYAYDEIARKITLETIEQVRFSHVTVCAIFSHSECVTVSQDLTNSDVVNGTLC